MPLLCQSQHDCVNLVSNVILHAVQIAWAMVVIDVGHIIAVRVPIHSQIVKIGIAQ